MRRVRARRTTPLPRLGLFLMVLLLLAPAFGAGRSSIGVGSSDGPAAAAGHGRAATSSWTAPAVAREPPARSAVSWPGSVNQTLILPDNARIDGNVRLPGCLDPANGVLDTVTGDLVIVCPGDTLPDGSNASVLAVVDPSTGAVLDVRSAPLSTTLILQDPDNGLLYSYSTDPGLLTGWNATTLSPVSAVPLAVAVTGMVYDPADRHIYLADGVGNSVSLVNLTTANVDHVVAVGTNDGWIVYDARSSEVYVTNFNDNNVSVISSTSHSVVANIAVGNHPTGIAYDPDNGLLYVASSGSGNVTLINGTTRTTVGSISTVMGQRGVQYASASRQILVVNALNSVSILNTTTDTVVTTKNVATGPIGLFEVPGLERVYVGCAGAFGIVSVLDERLDQLLSPLVLTTFPTATVYDPFSGEILASDSAFSLGIHGNYSRVDPISRQRVGTFPTDPYMGRLVVDPQLGRLYGAGISSDRLSIFNATTYQLIGTVPIGAQPGPIALDPKDGRLFVSNEGSNNVSVIDTATDSVLGSIAAGTNPVGIGLDPQRSLLYIANPLSGNLTVANASTGAIVTSIPIAGQPGYVEYDPLTGDMMVTVSSAGRVDVVRPSTESVVASIAVGSFPVGIVFDPLNGDLYVSNAATDNLSVISGETERSLASIPVGTTPLHSTFLPALNQLVVADFYQGGLGFVDLPAPPTYAVSFFGQGLPSGLGWNVTLANVTHQPSSGTVVFSEPNGSKYPFLVTAPSGWIAAPAAGSVDVSGGAVQVGIEFTIVPTYPVTFNETGLPVGSPWSVQLNGAIETTDAPSVAFSLPNGSPYPYVVVGPAHFVTSDSPGNLSVAGLPVSLTIAFAADVPAPTIGSFTAQPIAPGVGSPLRLTVVVDGGLAPFRYQYDGLPGGCASSNRSILNCTPNASGTFVVEVEVVDSLNRTANASLPVEVRPIAPTGSTNEGSWFGLPPTVLYATGGGLLVLLLLGLLLWYRRRGGAEDPGTPSGEEPPPGGMEGR